MTKRHTTLNDKQLKGQFFTSNATELLRGYEELVRGKRVVDPFAGDWDLLNWALENGATEIEGFDIDPQNAKTERRDSLLNPPDFQNRFLVSNPPYLSSNKNKDKRAYDRWEQNDLYKCHLASLIEGNCEGGILILPSNFISESRDKARDLFLRNFQPLRLDYYYYQVFPNATTGIAVIAFERKPLEGEGRTFPAFIHYAPENVRSVEIELRPEYKWLWGKEFFDRINSVKSPFSINKWTEDETGFLTNIVLGLLDKGSWQQGLSFNEGETVVCGKKSFTTYQLLFPNVIHGQRTKDVLTEEIQRKLVCRFNHELQTYRTQYHGLFLSNFMGADQKILSRDWCHKLLQITLEDLTL